MSLPTPLDPPACLCILSTVYVHSAFMQLSHGSSTVQKKNQAGTGQEQC